MGEEAPECLVDCNEISHFGCDSESQGYNTATILIEKIYVVGGSSEGEKSSFSVKIFDKLAGIWTFPTVLGMTPTPCKGHLSVSLSMDRILILKRDSPSDDCILILEVDTPFVKAQKKILGTEVVAWSKGVLGDGAMPIVISGPSGVGKGTLISRIMKEFPSAFGFSVSHTTRSPRTKEVDGVLTTSPSRAQWRMILEMESSLNMHQSMEIYMEQVSKQLKQLPVLERGTEMEEQVQKRLQNARAELEQGMSPGLFDHLLVNDDLESCYQDLKMTISALCDCYN